MKHTRLLSARQILPALIFAGLALAPAATAQNRQASASDAEFCELLRGVMAPQHAELEQLEAERDAAAETVEALGEAWEESEIHRRVSTRHAAAADRDKAAYDDARQGLARKELALAAALRDYNRQVATFNARCAPRN
jgi:sensor domain CHASE-containing protein